MIKQFWNDKFNQTDFFYGTTANQFLVAQRPLLTQHKTLLCLGEGEGRNAIFFAQQGFQVSAVDISDIGLNKLSRWAEKEHLNIRTLCFDVNHWQLNESFDVIVTTYLHIHKQYRKSLFYQIEQSLNKNAYFIAEFFSQDQLNYHSGGPKDIDLLYTVEEFEQYFHHCEKNMSQEIVELNEGTGHQGKASVIRIIAKKI